jgi:translation elongation factor EF-1alpha
VKVFDAKRSGKAALIVAALGGFLLLGGAPQLHARDRQSSCVNRMRKAEKKLGKAVKHHGQNSPQAQKAREKLEQARASCGEHRP